MVREISVIALVIGIWLGVRWLIKQPRQAQWKWGAIAVAIILIGLAATGRLHWVYALVAAIIPLIRRILGMLSYLPILKGFLNQFRNAPANFSFDQHSSVETRFLRIELDQASGKLFGTVKQGRHAGENLQDLPLQELVSLLQEYTRIDPESAQLLVAYLDRSEHTHWRSTCNQNTSDQRQRQANPSGMSKQEAYAILGLHEDASTDEIIEAHRRLMQKLHPDRGGNDYLAAKINQAKDLLL